MGEQLGERQFHAQAGAQPGDELHGQQRMAAALEEVILGGGLRNA